MSWKDHFSFTKQERTGIIFFMISAVILMLAFRFLPNKEYPEFDKSLADFYISSDSLPEESYSEDNFIFQDFAAKRSDSRYRDSNKLKRQKFNFDPNIISFDSLLLLGFSAFAAKNLVQYRNKGGRIYSVDKLKSIYGVEENLVNDLNDYIQFSVNSKFNTNTFENKRSSISVVSLSFVELNSADSAQLTSLKGIGVYRANQILKYRQRLGGFLYPEQLLEINQFPDSLFQTIKDFIEVDEELIVPININTADYKTLITHPYLDPKSVNLILNYRKQHGPFGTAKEIKRIRAFNQTFVEKILPYLIAE